MNKFEDVDVIASLEAIMKQNTAFYQNDFDLDRNILQKAAASPTAEDRRLLWFSRPSGTSCFRERDVFLKGTRQHNTWRFYGEQTRDKVLSDSNAERNAHKDENIAAISLTYNYKEFIMKKIISSLMTVFCVAIFSMSVFAENEAIKPHRLECPNCGRFSVVSVKNHTRTANNRQEPCDHYTQGTDEVMDIIAYYQDICGSCVYKSAEYSVDTGEDVRICHGWNG